MVTVTEVEVRSKRGNLAENTIKRCAIYIRVSTAEQRIEGWSLDAQRAALTAFAASKGWKVIKVYADEGKSARKRLKDRKAIFQLLEDVKAGEVDVILFKELDRWFRSVSDFYKVQDVLDQYGVEWVSQQQPGLEMRTKEGRLQVNVLLSVGQNETDATSDRIKYTNKYMRQQKRWTSGPSTLPRGYTLDDDQHVIIDPEGVKFTRALIDRFMQYSSVRKALVETNAEFPDYTMRYGNAINLLRNPMLYGAYKEVPDFVAEPIMVKDEWEHMQSRMQRNATYTPNHFYIFAGMLRCAGCGTVMHGTYVKGSHKKYLYYRCRRARLDGTCENWDSVQEGTLQKDLLAYVKTAVSDKMVQVQKVQDARKKKKPKKSNREAIEKQLDKLEDLYISDERMTREKYEEKKAAILAKLVEDEPEEQLPELADLEKIQALFDDGIEELYQSFTPEERREFWRGILTEVWTKDRKIVNVNFIE